MVLRQAEVYYKEHLVGLLSEVDSGYEFVYLPEKLFKFLLEIFIRDFSGCFEENLKGAMDACCD